MPKSFKHILCVILSVSFIFGNDILIALETEFQKSCSDNGIKNSFLNYLHPDAITFEPNPIMAYDWYNIMPDMKMSLNWTPEFSEISSDQKFGYTSGPWSSFRNSENDKVISYSGQYVTIWQYIDTMGWSIIVDGSVTSNLVTLPDDSIEIENSPDIDTISTDFEIVAVDKIYTEMLVAEPMSAYQSVAGNHFIEMWDDYPTMENMWHHEFKLKTMRKEWVWKIQSYQTDSNSELGYVLGVAELNSENDEIPVQKMSFLRIWKKSQGIWQLNLEMIKPIH